MRVHHPESDPAFRRRCREDLERLLEQTGRGDVRPCPGCELPCPCARSPKCTCACAPTCEHAPRHMSSDPTIHPIEPGIAPLVFAFYCLRVCPPCWSCEGHLDSCGALRRPPSLWFYAESTIYPRLVDEAVGALKYAGQIKNHWQVRVIPSAGDGPFTAFSFEPNLQFGQGPALRSLQGDIPVIARALPAGFRDLAQDHLERL